MIVDTSALAAIMLGEPEGDTLARIIAADPHTKMSAATAVEVYAVLDRRGQPAQTRRVDALIAELGITIIPVDEQQVALARIAYRDFGKGSGHKASLNLGDVFSYALAATTGEPLVYTGNDFPHTDINLAVRW